MKRPSFQFYPSDWRNDAALQSCSIAARGLWHEMLCLMHECLPYGHLAVNGKPMRPAQIARLVGVPEKEYAVLLAELTDAGVPSTTIDGTIYSRRMVRDEHIRNVRSQAGRLGGNPNLLSQKVKHEDNQMLNQEDNQGSNQIDKQSPTPSSSSSSSIKNKNKAARVPRFDAQAHLVSLGVPPGIAKDWLAVRKAKRLAPTATAFDDVRIEVDKAGIPMADAIRMCCVKGWGGFKASWLDERQGRMNGHASDDIFG